jgi:hypothetical protein
VVKVIEVYHYNDWTQYDGHDESTGMFTRYINCNLKKKQQASGWPAWVKSEEDKDRYIKDYMTHERIELEKDMIEKNEGMRAMSKLMLNSFWVSCCLFSLFIVQSINHSINQAIKQSINQFAGEIWSESGLVFYVVLQAPGQLLRCRVRPQQRGEQRADHQSEAPVRDTSEEGRIHRGCFEYERERGCVGDGSGPIGAVQVLGAVGRSSVVHGHRCVFSLYLGASSLFSLHIFSWCNQSVNH